MLHDEASTKAGIEEGRVALLFCFPRTQEGVGKQMGAHKAGSRVGRTKAKSTP